MNTQERIFEELFKRAEKHVKTYRTDFDIDKKTIQENSGTPFIHIAREHGTNINLLHKSESYPKHGETVKYIFNTADRKEILKGQLQTIEHYLNHNPLKITFFDGYKLATVTKDQAQEIYKNYYDRMLNRWELEQIEVLTETY